MIEITLTIKGRPFTYRAQTNDPAEAERRAKAFAERMNARADSHDVLRTDQSDACAVAH